MSFFMIAGLSRPNSMKFFINYGDKTAFFIVTLAKGTLTMRLD